MSCNSVRWSVGVSVGVAAAAAAVWTWRRQRQTLKWVEVGEVTSLMIYPIKSGGGYKADSAEATNYGLVVDNVVDRSFVVMMSHTAHVSSGMAPLLCAMLPTLKGGVLTLTPIKGDPFKVDIANVMQAPQEDFILKGDPVRGRDCGPEVGQWLTQALYGDSEAEVKPTVRLMYVGDAEALKRPATKPPFFQFTQYREADMQVYHDKCAFLLTATSSLEDLNSRLADPVSMLQLRPNIVVTGSPAYDEDDWAYIRIGEDVMLRTLKPRDACTRINVIPSTGKRQAEVLDTLKKYRVKPMPAELAKHWNSKPMFGIHMAMDIGGQINVGDKVYAIKKKPNWFL